MNTQTDTGPDDHPLEDNTRPSLFICLLLVDEGACDEGAGPNDGGDPLSGLLCATRNTPTDYWLEMKGKNEKLPNYLLDRRQQFGGGCVINS